MQVFTKEEKMPGCCTGRRWDEIVQALVDNGSIVLREGETITGVQIDKDYGLMFRIEKVIQPKRTEPKEDPEGWPRAMSRFYRQLTKGQGK